MLEFILESYDGAFLFGSIRHVARFLTDTCLISFLTLEWVLFWRPNPPTELLEEPSWHICAFADSEALFNTWIAEKFNGALIVFTVIQRCNVVKSRGCELHERHRIYVGSGMVNRIISQSSRLSSFSLSFTVFLSFSLLLLLLQERSLSARACFYPI